MAKKQSKRLERVCFTQQDNNLPMPNLIEHQLNSWEDLIGDGLKEIFAEVNPIEDYTGEKLSLTFLDHKFELPEITPEEAKVNNVSYEASLKVKVELLNKTTGETNEQEIYFGKYPWMTERASFVINGIERVVVSQLIRSPGVLFTNTMTAGQKFFGAKMIPTRGAWLEFETTSKGVIYVKIDRRRKLPVTTLLRAFGFTNEKMTKLFGGVKEGQFDYLTETLAKDPSQTTSEALIEVFSRLRPGDLATVENAKEMIEKMFFDFKRYDYGEVGRYKINQRLDLKTKNDVKHRTFQLDDLAAVVAEIIRLNHEQGQADDVDALYNRRVKLVGEVVARQFRIGLLRMQRNIMDRMAMVELDSVTPSQLINARPMVASVREFFASSQLSQFMDETNLVSELSHKRRLSSMGPGGLTRDRAGFEVRDLHPTHYGRICAVETPEGGNVGLVLNLATYARINRYGFIETPYLKVENGKVTDKIVYLDALEEEKEIIADAGAKLDKNNKFAEERVSARRHLQPETVDADEITYMDAAHRQILGPIAGLVPFVEKNRVDRALTGANMQRQAVPLIKPETPTVGTGIEFDVARNTSQLILASGSGVVKKATADELVVDYKKDGEKIYKPIHFAKSNDDRCINQRVVVSTGDKVKKDDILIEGASIADGELALGKDLRVAFMSWHGYNMDDALIISNRLVHDDSLTSINIKDYTVEVRETKLGPEIVTRDIPNVSEESLRNLDEEGIIQVGSEVRAGDVLVGKITPKGEQELSSEERLLRAIFGEKAKDVRDTSKRMNNSGGGKVIEVRKFTREDGHVLKAGVLMQIQIFVAEMRKISVGDKMAGRYGNKGVIAKILPEEDMPFTADGEPVDIILNPLGVPSRMNLGQLFEVHMGLAAKALGYKMTTISYNGVSDEQISSELEKAGYAKDGKVTLYDGQTGEAFKERVTVGIMHMMKLHHMVSDKIHARSTGPYTKVTQQPLGGKAQNGGQRLGEMEVWALEAYGASSVLQEMLTIKSDDVIGRSKAYESIIKDQPIVGPKIPESFNVLVKELQGLGLKVDLINTENDQEINFEEINDKKAETPTEEEVSQAISLEEELEAELDEENQDKESQDSGEEE